MCVCVCVLQIALRSMKYIELRLSGSVEPPRVDISMVSLVVARVRLCDSVSATVIHQSHHSFNIMTNELILNGSVNGHQ